jgi:hypothetical protein
MSELPLPVVEKHEGIMVVRDDLVPGGTKRRVAGLLLDERRTEYVYASPAFGYAQIALAMACRDAGGRATIFTAKRNKPHKRTEEAIAAGANVVMVPYGYLSNVQAKAKRYAEGTGAKLLPFGFDLPIIRDGIAAVASRLDVCPDEVWTVAGSGMLSMSLQMAWPRAKFFAVAVGAKLTARDICVSAVYCAPEPFERDAKILPPFPSCSNYDAKAWRFVRRYASKGAIFWNVAR